MLRIEKLVSGYGRIKVLDDVSMSVEAGRIVTIIGANGAGKSTLVNTISALLPVQSGSIVFKDEDVTHCSMVDIVRRRIIQVPEGRKLFGPLTVYENLMLGSHRIHRRAGDVAARTAFVFDLFPLLKERAHQRASTLSGGEQQMVTLARALMADPELILLDEPTLGLAPRVIDNMFRALDTLRARGLTLLLVEQRAEAALDLADYAYVMANGAIALHGPAQQVRSNEQVQSAYLGAAGREPPHEARPAPPHTCN